MIELVNISKEYRLGKTTVPAVQSVNLKIGHGDAILFSGPSGSGKTTLLNLLGLIDAPTKGEIFFDGNKVSEMNRGAIHKFRKKRIAFVFQTFNLIPVLSAYENIEFPLILNKVRKDERAARIREISEIVKITPHLRHRPDELSGGQRQRVAIARALAIQPEIIIADEPTANLDTENANIVIELLHNLNKYNKTTILTASHDPRFNESFSRQIRMVDGKIQ